LTDTEAIQKGIENLQGIKRDIQVAKQEAKEGKQFVRRTKLANKFLGKIEPFVSEKMAKSETTLARFGIKALIKGMGKSEEGKSNMGWFYGVAISSFIRKNGWDSIDQSVKKNLATRSLTVRALAKPLYPLVKKLVKLTIVDNPHFQSDKMDKALQAAEVASNTYNFASNVSEKVRGALEYVLSPAIRAAGYDPQDPYGIGKALAQETEAVEEDEFNPEDSVQRMKSSELSKSLAVTENTSVNDIIYEGAKAQGEKLQSLKVLEDSKKDKSILEKDQKNEARYTEKRNALNGKLEAQEAEKANIEKTGSQKELKNIKKEILKTELDIIRLDVQRKKESDKATSAYSKKAKKLIDAHNKESNKAQNDRLDKAENSIRTLQQDGKITHEKAEELLEYTDRVRPENLMPLGERGRVQFINKESDTGTQAVLTADNQAISSVDEAKGEASKSIYTEAAITALEEKAKGEALTTTLQGYTLNESFAQDLESGALAELFEMGEAPGSVWDYVPLFRHDWAANHKGQDGSNIEGTLKALQTLSNGSKETLERASHFLNKNTLKEMTDGQLQHLAEDKKGDEEGHWVQYNGQYLKLNTEDAENPIYTIKVNNHEGSGGKRNVVITLQAEYAIEAFAHGLKEDDKVHTLDLPAGAPDDAAAGVLTVATTIIIKEPYEVSSSIESMLGTLAQEHASGYEIREDYSFSYSPPLVVADIAQDIRAKE
tara:strand:- start:84790 stop:86934 length:2145 start_codon:yes stop_codon:yes gene_type:complete